MEFHAGLAEAARAPTEFRFLNRETPLLLGAGERTNPDITRRLREALREGPSGGTPLCYHIDQIAKCVQSVAMQLRQSGQKAVLVIATDGESSDGKLSVALKALERLPIFVVVRLCTDDEKIVNYWNNIDADLELDLDVLDDLGSEAQEVGGFNDWLNYAQPLHRMREFGITIKEFDLLDERTLSISEMYHFIKLMYVL
jgi:hypothetical protein